MENEKKYLVSVGSFASERSAIDLAELCKRNGIMAEIIPINGSPIENLTAAVLLIAEKLNSIEKIISKPEVSPRTKPTETLGFVIQRKRKEKGISSEQFAEQLSIHPTYLSKIEHDKCIPSNMLLKLIAVSLSFSASECEQFIREGTK